MPSQHRAVASAEQAIGTKDDPYNLVSVLSHALQGAETAQQYLQDADQPGDQELGQFVREVQDWQRHLGTRAKAVLTQRLSASDGRHWHQGRKFGT
jgi:hypothetical protein